MSKNREDQLTGERVCGREHYGFVVETSLNDLASEVWCVACKELIKLPENTVNAERKRLDWVLVDKEKPTVLRTANSWFQLRIRNNHVEAYVPFSPLKDADHSNRLVGYSMPLGRIGIFYPGSTMIPELYYMAWVTLLANSTGNAEFDRIKNKFKVKWINSKGEEPKQPMTLMEYIDWDKDAGKRQIIERAVVVKKEPAKMTVWKELYGMVSLDPRNIPGNRPPNVGDAVKGVFTKDFQGNWLLCSPNKSDGIKGIKPFDLLIESSQPDKPVILLQVEMSELTFIPDSDPPTYDVGRFAKLYDENQVLRKSEDKEIHSVIIKWLEDREIWQITNIVLKTGTMTDEHGIIVDMPVLCDSVYRNPNDPSENIEKVKLTPTHSKPYFIFVTIEHFKEEPVLGKPYMIRLGVNLDRVPECLSTDQIIREKQLNRSPFYLTVLSVSPLLAKSIENVLSRNTVDKLIALRNAPWKRAVPKYDPDKPDFIKKDHPIWKIGRANHFKY